MNKKPDNVTNLNDFKTKKLDEHKHQLYQQRMQAMEMRYETGLIPDLPPPGLTKAVKAKKRGRPKGKGKPNEARKMMDKLFREVTEQAYRDGKFTREKGWNGSAWVWIYTATEAMTEEEAKEFLR